jgi:hypothetical protein
MQGDLIIPAQGVRRVEFFMSVPDEPFYHELTAVTNRFIYISPLLMNQGLQIAQTVPGSKVTYTVWYNDERTDGTEWDLATKYYREITPTNPPPTNPPPANPTLVITPQAGSFKIALSGFTNGLYQIEAAPAANGTFSSYTLVQVSAGAGALLVPNVGTARFFRVKPAGAQQLGNALRDIINRSPELPALQWFLPTQESFGISQAQSEIPP